MYHEDALSERNTQGNEVRNDFTNIFTATLKVNLLKLEVNLFQFHFIY